MKSMNNYHVDAYCAENYELAMQHCNVAFHSDKLVDAVQAQVPSVTLHNSKCYSGLLKQDLPPRNAADQTYLIAQFFVMSQQNFTTRLSSEVLYSKNTVF